MNKKFIGLLLIGLLLFPTHSFANQVPSEVEQLIKQHLERFKPSLIDNGTLKC